MAVLDGAVLSRQNTVQLMFAFRLEDDVDEDRDNDEEAGQGHNQPRGHGVCRDINSYFNSLWTFSSVKKRVVRGKTFQSTLNSLNWQQLSWK